MATPRTVPPALLPALVLGLGVGAIVDGILLHEVLELHALLAATTLPRGIAAITPGMLPVYAAAWALTVAGLLLLHRDAARGIRWSSDRFTGGLALGWGTFNLVEGTLEHHVLGLHHLSPGAHALAWDLAFLAFGAGLVLLGLALTRGSATTIDVEESWPEAA